MPITLVRHAEVIEEYRGKYNGHIDIPLSENGKEQAKELAQKLQDEKYDKVYCSDLLRARQTLEAFSLHVEPIFTEKLREKSWGIHEGKSFEEISQMGIEYENFEQWIRALDGEDIDSYKQNIKEFFYNIVFKDEAQNTLIITHSGVIKTILGILNSYSLEESFSLKIPYLSTQTINIK